MQETGSHDRTPHEVRWGKKAAEVSFGDPCHICGSRVDEYGLCSCGAGGS